MIGLTNLSLSHSLSLSCFAAMDAATPPPASSGMAGWLALRTPTPFYLSEII